MKNTVPNDFFIFILLFFYIFVLNLKFEQKYLTMVFFFHIRYTKTDPYFVVLVYVCIYLI